MVRLYCKECAVVLSVKECPYCGSQELLRFKAAHVVSQLEVEREWAREAAVEMLVRMGFEPLVIEEAACVE